jgi:hypothetical protein
MDTLPLAARFSFAPFAFVKIFDFFWCGQVAFHFFLHAANRLLRSSGQ